jgi:hypothetical protein
LNKRKKKKKKIEQDGASQKPKDFKTRDDRGKVKGIIPQRRGAADCRTESARRRWHIGGTKGSTARMAGHESKKRGCKNHSSEGTNTQMVVHQ